MGISACESTAYENCTASPATVLMNSVGDEMLALAGLHLPQHFFEGAALATDLLTVVRYSELNRAERRYL
jgi:hypothetical protein